MGSNLGYKLSKIDLRDYKIKAYASANLPDSFELQFKHFIKDQGEVASCVPHATSSILEYYGAKKLSTNFIYSIKNQVLGDYDSGMRLVDACKLVKQYGDMLYKDCPGNIEAPKCYEQAANLLDNKEKLDTAYYYRIDSYYKCETNADIKLAIMNFGPVLAAIKWDAYTMESDGTLHFNFGDDFAYHAIMIYGWNEKGFLFQNSFGKNFGINGCAIVPYEYKIIEARCLIDHDNTNDNLPDGELVRNQIYGNLTDEIYKKLNRILNFLAKYKNK